MLPASSSFWGASLSPVFSWPLLFSSGPFSYKDTVIRSGPTLLQCGLTSIWSHPQRPSFQRWPHSQVPGLGCGHSFLGGTLFDPLHQERVAAWGLSAETRQPGSADRGGGKERDGILETRR